MDIQRKHWWQKLRYKLVASVLLMTIPLVVMLLYNNFYAIHTVRGQVADSYKNMLSLYMNQMDSNLNDIDAYMNVAAGGGYDLLSLDQAETDTEYYRAQIYLYNKLTKDITLYRSLNSFFVYVGDRNDFFDVSRTQDISIEEKDKIQSKLIDLIKSNKIIKGVSSKRWFYFQSGGEYYLLDLVQTGDVVLGAWLKTDTLLEPLQAMQLGEKGSILLANDQGEPITISKVQDTRIKLDTTLNEYDLSGSKKEFLTVGMPSSKGDFNLIALIPDRDILAKLPYLQGLIWFITATSLLVIPIGLFLLRKMLMVPLYRLLMSMKKVRQGDWSSRVIMDDKSEEFQVLGESFNAMMTEVETLRINVFEEQLSKQREELQRLQLQVNPHFFMNSLNIVYNLAKVRNYELIMEMTMSLIHYFRFMFRSNTSFVKLKEEMDHTRNYLRIQMLRFPGQLTWSVDMPEYLSDKPIPPLVIQSFVENAIKHAVTMDEPIHISVWIDFLDEEKGSYLNINIKDTGPGFKREILQELEAGRSVENERGEHTGIWNVDRRLKLLYGDHVSVRYYNDADIGGAAVNIILPTNPKMEEST